MTDDRAIDESAGLFGHRTEGAPPPPLVPPAVWRWLAGAALVGAVSMLSGLIPASGQAPRVVVEAPDTARQDLPIAAPRIVCQPDGQPVMVHVGQDGVPIVVALPADARCEPGDDK